MPKMNRTTVVMLIVPIALFSANASAVLIGQWTFDGPYPLSDSTGNYGDLALQGTAVIVDGQLDVNGAGTTPTGWAHTTGPGYTGGAITDKTLVAWLTLQSLSASARAGSAITIDNISTDHFDGIIFGESVADRWQNGSSFGLRNQAFAPGFQETATGSMILMVITYDDLGSGNVEITGYRNGSQIGQYTVVGQLGSWGPGDNEIILGARHTILPNDNRGGLDALIEEARIYNHVLSPQEIADLTPEFAALVPTLNEWGLGIFILLSGMVAVFTIRRHLIR